MELDALAFSRMVGPSLARIPRVLDLEDLNKRLENASSPRWASPGTFITPERETPESQRISIKTPDSEFAHQQDLTWEDMAREELKRCGCPPCCPSSFEYPYESPLGELEGLLGWWKARSIYYARGPNWVLRSQLEDWRRFCRWRDLVRPQPCTRLSMRRYMNDLQERRNDRVELELDVSNQTRLQTWIEFQDFHHQMHAFIQETGPKHELERHKALLDWIEEQRKIMVAEEDTTGASDGENAAEASDGENAAEASDGENAAEASGRENAAEASDEEFDPEAFSRMIGWSKARRPRPLDLEDLNRRLEDASRPHWASPGHFVTPERLTPESQQTKTSITPHPEEIRLGHVTWEREARETLEKSGCRPCCPSSFEYPYEGPLGQFEDIISWWKSRPSIYLSGPSWVIRAQLRDWERFCFWRAKRRPRRPTRLTLRNYVEKLQERRRAFGLPPAFGLLGVFHFECSTADQSPLQDWIEFQDYHHQLQAHLHKTGRKDEAEKYKILLTWIEEQRKIMVAEEAPDSPPAEPSHQAAIRQAGEPSSRPRRSRNKAAVKSSNLVEQERTRKKRSRPSVDNEPSESTHHKTGMPASGPGDELTVSKKPRNPTAATNPGVASRRSTRQR
ncbi:hypothetical protein IWZ00DRAFT_71739 [Phyllosticta capitalensis]